MHLYIYTLSLCYIFWHIYSYNQDIPNEQIAIVITVITVKVDKNNNTHRIATT